MDSNPDPFTQFLMLKNNCDPNDLLLSQTILGQTLANIPLDRLNSNELRKLSIPLNTEQLIPTNDGLPRDYRGLAELIGFNQAEVESRFKKSYNPTKSLLEAMIDNNAIKNGISKASPTVNDLLKFLEKLERFDVIDDGLQIFIRVARDYDRAKQRSLISRDCPNTNQICLSNGLDDGYDTSGDILDNRLNILHSDTDQFASSIGNLTIEDTFGNPSTLYDAFVCFAPEDFEYAQDLLGFLQQNELLVTTSQDLLPGMFEHDSITQMIDSRCRKVIIILTPNFARSKECEFQTKFASELNFKAKGPKIIPIIYEPYNDNELPSIIKVLSKIDLSNCQNRQWQMQRLLKCLQLEKQFGCPSSSLVDPYRNNPNLKAIDHFTNQKPTNDTSSRINPSPDQSHFSRTPIPIVEVMESQTSDQIFIPTSDHRPRSSSGSKNWFKSFMRKSIRSDDSSKGWSSSKVNLINNSGDSS